jgi:hypothetical protein
MSTMKHAFYTSKKQALICVDLSSRRSAGGKHFRLGFPDSPLISASSYGRTHGQLRTVHRPVWKIPPAHVAEMLNEISKPTTKERESLFERDHFYQREISRLMAEERGSPSQEDYFYFGRTHEEDKILLLKQRREVRKEFLLSL